jgi:hypothetical protein
MISAWEKSSVTQTAFCEQHGLSRWAFSWWKRELEKRSESDQKKGARTTKGRNRNPERGEAGTGRRGNEKSSGSMPTFVPVQIKESQWSDFSGEPVEVILGNGYRLRVSPHFDAEGLRRLLEVLV